MVMGDWLQMRRKDQINNYAQDNGSQVSHCWKRELRIWKREKARMNSVEWNWILV